MTYLGTNPNFYDFNYYTEPESPDLNYYDDCHFDRLDRPNYLNYLLDEWLRDNGLNYAVIDKTFFHVTDDFIIARTRVADRPGLLRPVRAPHRVPPHPELRRWLQGHNFCGPVEPDWLVAMAVEMAL